MSFYLRPVFAGRFFIKNRRFYMSELNQTQISNADGEAEKQQKISKKSLKEYFTATRIAYIAIFTALSFVLRMLQFSV